MLSCSYTCCQERTRLFSLFALVLQAVYVELEDDESPTGLLDVLEDKELVIMETKYKTSFEQYLPLDAVRLVVCAVV